ncbi:hypothetical protein NSND_60282 [Nitrospira sp. ND1]|nr:hypothetical protein NSND_60282 [Nitrospira sp. ND1]
MDKEPGEGNLECAGQRFQGGGRRIGLFRFQRFQHRGCDPGSFCERLLGALLRDPPGANESANVRHGRILLYPFPGLQRRIFEAHPILACNINVLRSILLGRTKPLKSGRMRRSNCCLERGGSADVRNRHSRHYGRRGRSPAAAGSLAVIDVDAREAAA